VTATFNCSFNGLIFFSWPSGVDISEVGGSTDGFISVVNGSFQFILVVDDMTPNSFNLTFDIISSDNFGCANPSTDDFSTTYTHNCVFPDNNNCTGAITLGVTVGSTCTPSVFSTTGATNSAGDACGTGYNDLWYDFTAINTTMYLSIYSGPGAFTYVGLYPSCGGTYISCTGVYTGGPPPATYTLNSLSVGTQYKLRVKFLASSTGTDQSICLRAAANLPVELGNFSAKLLPNERKIKLQWMTYSEVNFDKFVIQKKIGENGKWYEIKEISGKSATGSDYEYEDNDIRVSDLYFYRLKLVDLDGSEEFSDEKVVSNVSSSRFKIYPTYSDGNFTLLVPEDQIQQNWKVIITRIDGVSLRSLYENELNHIGAMYKMDLTNLENGTYLINMLGQGINKTEKLVIQK